jgi:hypothetical protein
MKKLLNKIVKNSYMRHSKNTFGLKIPFYINLPFKKLLCVYAMDMDWNSLRIKIESRREEDYGRIIYVIKKGKY